MTLPLLWTLNWYSSVSGFTRIELATTNPCSLQLLAFPLVRAGHHFVDVLVVLGAFAQRRPQSKPGEGEHEDHRR